MAIVRWDPFAELDNLHNQLNSMFNNTFSDRNHLASLNIAATDVYSDDNGLTIEAQLPNFKDSEISIEQHQGELEIKAEHQEKEEDKSKKKYLLKESVSKYYRRFTLPKNADVNNIGAKFEGGVLKVYVPYKELPAPKKIAIGSGVKKSKLNK